jgi:hypothetical protein
MPWESDATLELKDRWSLASSTARQQFRNIVIHGCQPPRSDKEPFAAVIRLWLRLQPQDQSALLNWMDSRLSMSQ